MRRHLNPTLNPMGVISKDSINKWIVTQLSSGKIGENLTVVEACEIVAAIVHT